MPLTRQFLGWFVWSLPGFRHAAMSLFTATAIATLPPRYRHATATLPPTQTPIHVQGLRHTLRNQMSIFNCQQNRALSVIARDNIQRQPVLDTVDDMLGLTSQGSYMIRHALAQGMGNIEYCLAHYPELIAFNHERIPQITTTLDDIVFYF